MEIRVEPNCYKCGKALTGLVAINEKHPTQAWHASCAGVVPDQSARPLDPDTGKLVDAADGYIKALRDGLSYSETEVTDLRSCLQMFLDNCPECRGRAFERVDRVNYTTDAEGCSMERELVTTHEPCATALALLRSTEPVHE